MPTVSKIDPSDFTLQFYESKDENLISTFDVNTVLTGSSYIEFYIYSNNKNLLYSTTNYISYTILNDGQSAGNNNEISQFNISPGEDVTSFGYNQGEYVAYYNFLTKQIGDPNTNLFISEISSDRTEIRLDSNILSNLDIVEQTNNFTYFRDNSNYFVDFYLNFGSNDLIISNNISLEDEGTNDPTIIVKLYEPLPSQFELKNQLWVCTTFNEPEVFNVNYPSEPIVFVDSNNIAGPNFNLPIKDQINNSTQNLSYTDLISGAPTSSLNQLNSLMDSSSLSINVDYTDFNDFIHFSSAQTRLENFYYKVSLIENHSSSISNLNTVTSSATSINIIENKVSDIIKNFDGFEYFLYYNSGSSYSWPKTTPSPPYLLAKTGSTEVLTWFGSDIERDPYYGGRISSASTYDNANKDQLYQTIPEYLREDSANKAYELFVDMVAQYYDNVWLYTKDITQKYNADNRLDFGVSKDLVANAIRDFGVKLYQNNFSKDDLYTAFLGLTPSGSLFPFPEITSIIPATTGFEYVNTLVSASNDIIPLDDVNKSLYKRLYHNIPYLLKSKGTIAGLRALITSYGIPDTILRISEFGGKDKVNANDYDYYFNKFNYSWDADASNYISTPWNTNTGSFSGCNPEGRNPNTLQFRFKTQPITGITSSFGLSSLSQSLWYVRDGSGTSGSIVLEYSGSGLDTGSLVNDSGSYDGSIKDPYYQYGTLKYINSVGVSASIYLPFFDGGWWSTMLAVDSDLTASLYAGNKIYNGKDGTSIGYLSSSTAPAEGYLMNSGDSYFAKTGLSDYTNFSGSIQEIRYYAPTISESIFKDYIMNPLSIEGNSINSSPNELMFRAGLGSELNTSTATTQVSIHPKVTGSWATASSFVGNSNYNFAQTPTYSSNTEYYFLDQFPAGIKNRITDKIRYENNVVPEGATLSPFRRVTQQTEASASYTENINYLEVAFSPQNEINDDIVSQLGYFNIGDYIGDPRQRSSSLDYYPDLNNLSEAYFEKYIKNYDLVDFVRLIKFFDNSLFKMIKDFVPARTSLASGIVIKQHLLERNKYPQPQVSHSNHYFSGSITSHQLWDPVNEVSYISTSKIESFSGGAGGMMNPYNKISKHPMQFGVSLWDGPGNPIIRVFLNSNMRGVLGQVDKSDTPTDDYSYFPLLDIYENENFYINAYLLSGTPLSPTLKWQTSGSYNVQDTFNFRLQTYAESLSGISSNPNILLNPFAGEAPMLAHLGKDVNYITDGGLYSIKTTDSFIPIQQWTVTSPTLSGSISKIHDSQDEFYNGEFLGSDMLITNGELNPSCSIKNLNIYPNINYNIRLYGITGSNNLSSWSSSLSLFNSPQNEPLQGNISVTQTSASIYNGVLEPDEYIKISNYDYNGINMAPTLEELTQISIEYDTKTLVYKIIEPINSSPYSYHFKAKRPISYPTTSSGRLASVSIGTVATNPNYGFIGTLENIGITSSNETTNPSSSNHEIPLISGSQDNHNFYNPNSKTYSLNTYLQDNLVNVYVTASVSVSFGAYNRLGIFKKYQGVESLIGTSTDLSVGGPYNLFITAYNQEIYPGTQIYPGFYYNQAGSPPVAVFGYADINTGSMVVYSLRTLTPSVSLTGPEPFTTTFFSNSPCNVLQGEAVTSRPNPLLQDVDYTTSTTRPVNYLAIQNDTAIKATVPESNYTQLTSTNIRYNGSKNQSEKINQWTKGTGLTDFSQSFNIGTYGKTSPIEVYDTVIYEYEWAGGTSPEILGWGAYKMGKLLNVKTIDDVITINPGVGLRNQLQPIIFPLPSVNLPYYNRNEYISQSVSEYYYTLNGNNQINSNITIFPYETTIGESSPTITKVLTPDFGVPTVSNFALTSSNIRYGNINAGSQHIYFTQSVDISRVKKSNGDYASGEVFDPESFLTSPSESLYSSLNEGERWFITLFNELEFPINNIELIPYNVGFSGSLEDNYIDPLGYKGVFEIFGAYSIDPSHFSFLTSSPFLENRIIGGNDLGALIWKARASGDNEFVMVQSEVGSNGPGCFVDQYATNEIIQNLDKITKEFGSNTT